MDPGGLDPRDPGFQGLGTPEILGSRVSGPLKMTLFGPLLDPFLDWFSPHLGPNGSSDPSGGVSKQGAVLVSGALRSSLLIYTFARARDRD